MESWSQPHYTHTGMMNQMQIWVSPRPRPWLISVEGHHVRHTIAKETNKHWCDDHTRCLTHPSPLHRLPPFLSLRHGCVWAHFPQQWQLTLLLLHHWILLALWTRDQRAKHWFTAWLQLLFSCCWLCSRLQILNAALGEMLISDTLMALHLQLNWFNWWNLQVSLKAGVMLCHVSVFIACPQAGL